LVPGKGNDTDDIISIIVLEPDATDKADRVVVRHPVVVLELIFKHPAPARTINGGMISPKVLKGYNELNEGPYPTNLTSVSVCALRNPRRHLEHLDG
jgi:hypothetical protein